MYEARSPQIHQIMKMLASTFTKDHVVPHVVPKKGTENAEMKMLISQLISIFSCSAQP